LVSRRDRGRRLGGRQGLDPYIEAAFGEQASDDVSVATVIARPGKNDRRPRREAFAHRRGDGAASPLHEIFLARAGFDRLPVGARHLGDGEDLERGGDGSHSTLVAASAPRSTRTRP
jgi:hypothetical protein